MEQRQHERVPSSLPIRVRISDINEFTEANSTNLSEGGIFIKMNYPPPVGSEIHVEFLLESAKKSIHIRGEVVRSVPLTEGSDDPSGIAVSFTDLGKDGRRFIELVVRQFNHRHPSRVLELPEGFFAEDPKAPDDSGK